MSSSSSSSSSFTLSTSGPSLKLYTYPNNYRAQKALIAAQYTKTEIECPTLDMGKADHKSPAYLARFPTGKVPALDTPEGGLFESGAIARYVARTGLQAGLLGSSFYEQGQVDQWLDWCTNEFEAPRGVWYYTVAGWLQNNPKAIAEAKKDVVAALKFLDNYLLSHTFFAGNQVTLADISIFCSLVDVFAKLLAPEVVKSIPNVVRWFNTVANQPEVSAVIKKVEFAKEEAQLPKGDGKGKDKAEKAEKPEKKEKSEKKEAAPAAAAAAAAPGGGDDDGDLDDNGLPKEKKVKSALEELPPSNMVLDSMKKLAFSERPIKKTFFAELWPQFDAAGYTWYISDYNYNNENTVFFKTGNAVGGFIQRCDAVRKYALGVMNIIGNADEETGPWDITGAWLFRGPGVPAVEMLSENPDSEYYTWKKVDISTAEGKKEVEDQFMAETLRGKAVNDRRYFK